ncbi:hypothetical protein GCM10022226_26250 [Sphaerisporangium flaviroseum]|uniref:Uncharacterized protein n=1 Tax=Sphaerisporangium flaviroseum TaxID=509199 RepID=A0ABP7HW62_9ACTN
MLAGSEAGSVYPIPTPDGIPGPGSHETDAPTAAPAHFGPPILDEPTRKPPTRKRLFTIKPNETPSETLPGRPPAGRP